MNKNLRPLWSTIVDPSEYDFDKQMEDWLKDANADQADFHGIDVGKMWGLYLSWKEQQERIAKMEAMLKQINDKMFRDDCYICGQCPSIDGHKEDCEFAALLPEGEVF